MCEVEPTFGSVCLQDEDFSLNGDIPFFFTRRYNNHATYSGPLGLGWAHAFDLHLASQGEQLALVDEEVRQVPLPRLKPGESVRNPTEGFVLERTPEAYLIHAPNGKRLTFAAVPDGGNKLALLRSDKTNDNTLWFSYAHGLLRELQNSSGHLLVFAYDQHQRIKQIRLRLSNEQETVLVSYTYDSHGQLTHAYDAEGRPFIYEYTKGLLTRYTNRMGGSYYLEYDQQRRCVTLWRDGYTKFRRYQYDDKRHATLITNSLGESALIRYNELDLPVETVLFDGSLIQRAYDTSNKPLVISGPLPPQPLRKYDEFQNLIEEIGPEGETSKWQYDARGRLIEEVEANGNVFKYEYDDSNHLVRQINPLGGITTYEYDGRGLQVAKRTVLGNEVRAQRSAAREFRLDDSLGHLHTSQHDEFGNTTEITNAAGHARSFRYDQFGQVTAIIPSAGRRAERQYDANGYLIYKTDFAGNPTRYERDPFGLYLKMTNALGQTVTYNYDSERRVISARTSTGIERKFSYDSRWRLVRESTQDGYVEEFAYDAQGNRTSVVRAGGLATHYSYTPSGLISEIRSGASRASYDYDELGNCRATQTEQHSVERVYGPEDVLLRETQDEFLIEYEYDAAGSVTLRRDSTGRTARYSYDVRGQLVEMDDTLCGQHRFAYDEYGRKDRHFLPNGISRQYVYDEADCVAKVITIGAAGNILKERRYAYTPTYELARAETAGEESVLFDYDAGYRLRRMVSAGGDSERFDYDLDGNIINSSAHGAHSYEGRQLRAAGPYSYRYDPVGRVAARAVGEQTAYYSYGLGGLIIAAALPDGKTYHYEYDGFGRRAVKRGPDVTIRYFWDTDALLMETHLTPQGEMTISYAYFPNSFRPLSHMANGQLFHYDFDQRGLVREVYDADGRAAARYRYRAFGQREVLSLASPEADAPFRLLGQTADAETGLHYNRFRYYDPEVGRFLSRDLYVREVEHNPYGYWPNPIGWADPYGLMPFNQGKMIAFKEENKEANGGFYVCANCGFKNKNRTYARTAETGKEVGDGSFQGDHVEAQANGGSDDIDKNAQVLCGTCNCSKGKDRPIQMCGKDKYPELDGNDKTVTETKTERKERKKRGRANYTERIKPPQQ